jgi:hypothetical protein
MSYQQPPPSDEPAPAGSPPPPPPEEPVAPPPPPPADPAAGYESTPGPGGGARATSGMSADQFRSTVQEANPYDLGIIAAGVVAFLLSFFPYYTVSVGSGGFSASGSASAWHGFFGWFGVLVALAAAVLLALRLFGVHVLDASMTRLAVLVGFAVSLLCIILALFIIPGKSDCGSFCSGVDWGHGFGYWASAIVVIVGLVLAFLRKDATD